MGIYIYGAEIPKDRCSSISVYGDGTILLRDGNKIVRLDNCKAIKIKQPHGDLIDKEEVFKVIEHETLGSRWGEEIGTDEETYIGKFKTIDDIDMIPTVIEAEGE